MRRFVPLLAVLALAAPLAAQVVPEAEDAAPRFENGTPGVDSLAALAPSVLPDRTVDALAGLLLGTGDDPSLLALRYRGTEGVQFVVDGGRASGVEALPLAALQSLAVRPGFVPARLGGVLGAFVEVDTREAPRQRLGRAEGVAGLDAYGYGRAALSLGGGTDRLRVYGAGEFERADDFDPRAYGTPALPADELATLRASPQVFRIDRVGADASGFDASGARYTTPEAYYVPVPSTLSEGATVADLAAILGLSDPALLDPYPISSLRLRNGEVPLETVSPAAEGERLRGHAALEFTPSDALRLRLSGQGFREAGRAPSSGLTFAAPEAVPVTREDRLRGALDADVRLGTATLTVAASAERMDAIRHDGRFSESIEDLLRYGDIDDPANATARAYWRALLDLNGGVRYSLGGRDGTLTPGGQGLTLSTFAPIGAAPVGYAREEATVLRGAASLRQRLGAVDVEIGFDVEGRTARGVEVRGAQVLALFAADESPEYYVIDTDGDGVADSGVERYADFPFASGFFFDPSRFLAYGYDYLGLNAADEGTGVEDYEEARANNTLSFAPQRSSLASLFADGEWESGDVTLRAGVRVARFASNANALYDPFTLTALYRVDDFENGTLQVNGITVRLPSGGVPGGVPTDAVFYINQDREIVGYRDREGQFYDASGGSVEAQDVLTEFRGSPLQSLRSSNINEDVVVSAPTTIRVLPRVEAEVRIRPETVASVFYNAFARQPDPSLAFPTLLQIENGSESSSSGRFLPSGGLRPERLSEFGASIRQRLGAASGASGEVGVNAFYRRYRDGAIIRYLLVSFPGSARSPTIWTGTCGARPPAAHSRVGA